MDRKTPLYERHVELGARMEPFAGFMMPIKYTSVREEHNAVRENVGVFDLSHMGEIRVSGEGATAYLDNLLTNDADVPAGKAFYSAMCYPDGGIVDDLVVYRLAGDEYLAVVNASNIEKDWAWMNSHTEGFDVELANESYDTALIAVQGPKAQALLSQLTDTDLEAVDYYAHSSGEVAGRPALIARTGYTGEDGFEVYVANPDAAAVWDAVMEAGSGMDAMPVGLGARDTLRLEVGYLLYGSDMDHTTTPVEARLSWVLKLKTDKDFIGREVISRQKSDRPARYIVGMEALGKGFPRHGTMLFEGDRKVGMVTSGSLAPALGHGVCLGYVERGTHKRGTELEAEVRGRRIPVRIVGLPFYKEGSRRS